jgi:ABC-type lipoprotein export system ATPase subunit
VADSDVAVELSGICVTDPPRVLLDEFSARFGQGMTALLGPSGSGKTTILALIAGLERPDRGSVTVPDSLRHPNGIGVGWLMQSANVMASRTVLDNVKLPMVAMGVRRSAAAARAVAALELLGIGPLTSRRAGSVSGGERQRVAIARVLASEALLVLADEPTASLGDEHRALVVDHLEVLGRSGRVVVIATHDPWVAARCEHVVDLRATALVGR